jgi:hypothetical protein
MSLKNLQSNIIPFKQSDPQANTEPIIDSDYWGTSSYSLLDLLQAVKENKNEHSKD